MSFVFDAIKLLLSIGGSIFLWLIIIFSSIAIIIIAIYHFKNYGPKEVIVYKDRIVDGSKTKTVVKTVRPEDNIKPARPILLFEDYTVTSYPNKTTKAFKRMDNKQTLDHLNSQLQARSNLSVNTIEPTLIDYYDKGSNDMVHELNKELNQIERPIWGLWLENIDTKLDDLDILDTISKTDLDKLYETARHELKIEGYVIESTIKDFIKETLAYINPTEYEIFQSNQTIELKYDLEIGEKYDNVEFTTDMNQYSGRIANISEIIRSNDDQTHYKIDIDHEENIWSKDMFEIL